MKINMTKCKFSMFFVTLILGFVSCTTTKNVPYFQDISLSSTSLKDSTADFNNPRIQVDDILAITILTNDSQSASVINQASSNSSSLNSQNQSSGYLVDKNGEIELAVVGKIKLLGLTTFEARDVIRTKVSKTYVNPSVQVRFANFKVTVLGEVAKPAVYTMPSEKISILDAIGLAGDLTIYGKRENILLIRENNGRKQFTRLDLTSADIFSNPNYYLRQNDVIYVEPNKAKIAANNAARTQTITIISSTISLLVIVVTRLF